MWCATHFLSIPFFTLQDDEKMEPSLLRSTLLVSRFKLVSYIRYLSCEPMPVRSRSSPGTHPPGVWLFRKQIPPASTTISSSYSSIRSSPGQEPWPGQILFWLFLISKGGLNLIFLVQFLRSTGARSFFQLYNTNKMITVLHKIMVPIVENKTSFKARKLNARIRRKRLKISLET